MSQNDDLAITIISAALIASRAVDIHDYDRQLLNAIMEAGGDQHQLLQLPVMRQLRTLAHAIHTVVGAPIESVAMPPGGPMTASTPCAHPRCHCSAAVTDPYSPFCSEHCQTAGHTTELWCDCQHPACRELSTIQRRLG
jgi:hypothetical protein